MEDAAHNMAEDDPCAAHAPPTGDFRGDGFVRLERLISPATAAALAERLERVLRCEYDAGVPPDKRPRAP